MRDHIAPIEKIVLTRGNNGSWAFDTGTVGVSGMGAAEMLRHLSAHIMPAEAMMRRLSAGEEACLADLPDDCGCDCCMPPKKTDDEGRGDDIDNVSLRDLALSRAIDARCYSGPGDLIATARMIEAYLKGESA